MMRAVTLAFVVGASAQSMKDCGQSSDHWKFSELSITPDPPVAGQNVTMVIAGQLDEDIPSGTVSVSVKAGPISIPASDIPFAISPTSHGTPVKVTFGPFLYPNVKIPLIKTVQTHVLIKDANGDQVACVQTNFPSYSTGAEEATLRTDPIANCGKASDHLKNLQITLDPPAPAKGKNLTVTTSGDTDEDISSGVASVSINLVIAKIELDIPFSISPAVPKVTGMKATVGPMLLPKIPLIPNVQGSIKVTEQKGEEVTCLNFNLPVEEESTVVV